MPNNPPSKQILRGVDDYTLFLNLTENLCQDAFSFSTDDGWRFRGQDCSCFAKGLLSRTIRELQRPDGYKTKATRRVSRRALPATWEYTAIEKGRPCSINKVSKLLYSQLSVPADGVLSGLLVVSGSTSSGKSQIARNLIHIYLTNLLAADPKRRPHLITFEDPIESEFWNVAEAKRIDRPIDYTPRQKTFDANSLNEVVNDALRQTPKVLYVGEVRDIGEWKELIRFAGTGHLAVTTTHADSVQECLGHILEANNADNAVKRSVIASRLVAAAHIRKVSGDRNDCSILVPAMWHKTPGSVMQFISQGLASVLPNRPTNNQRSGSIGRAWFAQELTKGIAGTEAKSILKKAVHLDLEGR
jgi:Tfp pilus assembly pilus retraction ATPase PilT